MKCPKCRRPMASAESGKLWVCLEHGVQPAGPSEANVEPNRGTVDGSKRRSKYGNVKTERAGLTFDSKKEADYYEELCLRAATGEIENLQCQYKIPIIINGDKVCTYVADFVYLVGSGAGRIKVFVDVKGVRTPMYRLKKKLCKALYGIDIVEV